MWLLLVLGKSGLRLDYVKWFYICGGLQTTFWYLFIVKMFWLPNSVNKLYYCYPAALVSSGFILTGTSCLVIQRGKGSHWDRFPLNIHADLEKKKHQSVTKGLNCAQSCQKCLNCSSFGSLLLWCEVMAAQQSCWARTGVWLAHSCHYLILWSQSEWACLHSSPPPTPPHPHPSFISCRSSHSCTSSWGPARSCAVTFALLTLNLHPSVCAHLRRCFAHSENIFRRKRDIFGKLWFVRGRKDIFSVCIFLSWIICLDIASKNDHLMVQTCMKVGFNLVVVRVMFTLAESLWAQAWSKGVELQRLPPRLYRPALVTCTISCLLSFV